MKRFILIAGLLLVTSNAWAYNETDLVKIKALNSCEGCDLSGAYLSGANLTGANLSGANLTGADLRRANLTRADLYFADLIDANLIEAKLTGATLRRANLSGAALSNATFFGTNLRHANLSGAYLSGADLSGANLTGADLSGAYLRDATLSDTSLKDVKYCKTEMPWGDVNDDCEDWIPPDIDVLTTDGAGGIVGEDVVAELGDNPLYQTLIQNDELENIINADLEKELQLLKKNYRNL